MKGIVYIGFAALFMWLGSILTDKISNNIDSLAVDHEEIIATTSSVVENKHFFNVPGVFIVMPGSQQQFISCEMKQVINYCREITNY